MSQQPNENETPQGHPAWQSILDKLPEDLHNLVLPELQNWDKGVQQKLQEVRSQYEPYKPLIDDEVDLEDVQQAMYLMDQFRDNPQSVIDEAIKHFGLKYAPVTEEEEDPDMTGFGTEEFDITKHPAFKALQEGYSKLETEFTTKKQREEAETAQQQLERELNELQTAHEADGPFDKLYVTALMSNGVDAEVAVKQYYDTVNQAAARIAGKSPKETPPVIMGGDGNTGSGVPTEEVNMGTLKDSQVNDIVMQMLKAAQTNDS